jgi:hypothetical protein
MSATDHGQTAGYIGVRHHAYRRRWESMLRIGDSISSGMPQRSMDYAAMSSELRESFYRGTSRNASQPGGSFPLVSIYWVRRHLARSRIRGLRSGLHGCAEGLARVNLGQNFPPRRSGGSVGSTFGS